jgi:hypothetical protein
MTSQLQIEANRRNAQKSTGPKTPEGKTTVSMNSLVHGLRARRVVLPGESEEDFRQLCADLEARFQPQDRAEQILVEEMAISHWKLIRYEAVEGQIMMQNVASKQAMALLVPILQQQMRLKNSYHKSIAALEHLKKIRPAPQDHPAEPVEEQRIAAAAPTIRGSADEPTPVDPVPAPCELAALPCDHLATS